MTSGLVDVLTVDEANAVLAHEIGHIEHWDLAVMTIAALAPLLLYQVYAFTRNISSFRALAYGAYLFYWVSQFVVLLLNRTREYFADHYAAEVTRAPEALSSALIKIAYGMVKSDGQHNEALKRKTVDEQMRREHRIAGFNGGDGDLEPSLRRSPCSRRKRRCRSHHGLGPDQTMGAVLRVELDPTRSQRSACAP